MFFLAFEDTRYLNVVLASSVAQSFWISRPITKSFKKKYRNKKRFYIFIYKYV